MRRIRIYSEQELKKILKNPNVDYVKNNWQIHYSNYFKLWSVQEKIRHPEKTSRQIFEDGGFDMKILDEQTPQKRLCLWIKKYKKFGSDYFISKNKYTYKAKDKNVSSNKLYVLEIKNDELIIHRVGK